MKKTFFSASPYQTKKIGEKLAKCLKPKDVVALIGELGCGKTIFSQGIAQGLKVKENIPSASFVLLQKFQGKYPFYHFDFYRLEEKEIEEAGFEELFENTSIFVIEWAEKGLKILPKRKIIVKIEYLGKNKRKITIEGPKLKIKGI